MLVHDRATAHVSMLELSVCFNVLGVCECSGEVWVFNPF